MGNNVNMHISNMLTRYFNHISGIGISIKLVGVIPFHHGLEQTGRVKLLKIPCTFPPILLNSPFRRV